MSYDGAVSGAERSRKGSRRVPCFDQLASSTECEDLEGAYLLVLTHAHLHLRRQLPLHIILDMLKLGKLEQDRLVREATIWPSQLTATQDRLQSTSADRPRPKKPMGSVHDMRLRFERRTTMPSFPARRPRLQ